MANYLPEYSRNAVSGQKSQLAARMNIARQTRGIPAGIDIHLDKCFDEFFGALVYAYSVGGATAQPAFKTSSEHIPT